MFDQSTEFEHATSRKRWQTNDKVSPTTALSLSSFESRSTRLKTLDMFSMGRWQMWSLAEFVGGSSIDTRTATRSCSILQVRSMAFSAFSRNLYFESTSHRRVMLALSRDETQNCKLCRAAASPGSESVQEGREPRLYVALFTGVCLC